MQKTGESVNAFFETHHVNKYLHHVGLGLLCGYTYNLLDAYSYEQYEAMFEGVKPNNLQPAGYQTLRVLPALIFSYGKRFTVNVRIMGGVLLLKTPVMDYPMETNYYATVNQVESQSGNDLAYDFGIGLKYSISRKISILLNADYFHSSPEIEANNRDYTFNISEITTTIGVGYAF